MSLVVGSSDANTLNGMAAHVRIQRKNHKVFFDSVNKANQQKIKSDDMQPNFDKLKQSKKVVELERVLDKAVKRIEETETNIALMITKLLEYFERRVDNLADALDNQSRLFDKVTDALADDKAAISALTDAVADDKAAISAFDRRFSANQNEVDDIAENMEELNHNFTYLLRRLEDCVPNLADEPPKKRKAKAKG